MSQLPPSRTAIASTSQVEERASSRRGGLEYVTEDCSGTSPISWNDLERGGMRRANDREVPAIERGELHEIEALGRGDDRGIHGAEGKVSIGRHELGDPDPVRRANRLRDQVPAARLPRNRTSAFVPSRVSRR
jgi:hypothetical protein